MTDEPSSPNRRGLLKTLASELQTHVHRTQIGAIGNEVSRSQPVAGSTIRLSTRAMACDFSVIMEPGPTDRIEAAGDVLSSIHEVESWLSIYRDDSELSQLNRMAFDSPVAVRPELARILELARAVHQRTAGAFDFASGTLTRLWRLCRRENRIPLQSEVDAALSASGMAFVQFNAKHSSSTIADTETFATVRFQNPGIILDPGAIGKGFALDEAAEWMNRSTNAPRSFLLHGGHSSLVARGPHNGHCGWPVGIGNPLLTEKRLGTLLLCDQAMGTSGSNIQFFRHEGRRYGHILDPRTGWPVDGMLSVTVLAPSAALADALSTAFFVMGVEKARLCCEKWPGVSAILLPFPKHGTKVSPTVVGLSPDLIVWDETQVDLSTSSTSFSAERR